MVHFHAKQIIPAHTCRDTKFILKIDKIRIKMQIIRVAQIFDCHFKMIEDKIIEICNKIIVI